MRKNDFIKSYDTILTRGLQMLPILRPVTKAREQKEPKLDILTLTEEERNEITKQIKACLEIKIAEGRMTRAEAPQYDTLIEREPERPERPNIHSLAWYRGEH